MPTKRGVLFDFDGVLFNTPPAYYALYEELAEEFQVPRFNSYDAWLTMTRASKGNWYWSFTQMGIPAEKHRAAEQYFGEHVLDHVALIKPYEGIVPVFQQFRKQGLKIGIVSSNYTEYIQKMCAQFEIIPDTVVGFEYGLLKPCPEPLWEGVKRLGLSGEEVIYIGDMRVDLLAGRAAEISTVLVTYGFEPEELLQELKPTLLAHKPSELLQYV